MSTVVGNIEKIKKALGHLMHVGLRSPKKVTLMITNECNLQCRHCWPESLPSACTTKISHASIIKMIQVLEQLEVEEVCLTGGEPLTHPHWFEILSYACKQSKLKKVCLQTNATLLSGLEIEALKSLHCDGLSIQVSIDGASAQTHDYVRGAGSFELASRGLRALSEGGLGKQSIVAFTEMEHNFMELPLLLEMVDFLGIGGLVSGTLVPAGRAGKTEQIAPPRPSQYRDLLSLFHHDAEFRSRYTKIGNIAALEWYAGRSTPTLRGCICGEAPYINAYGQMFPCVMLPIEIYGVHGVYHRPFEEVLNEAALRWAELPDLYRRRTEELEACKECVGRLHCAGGCMGRAYAVSGDFMMVEDRCALRKSVYLWNTPADFAFIDDESSCYDY
ncbi:MAG: radical SAM protein [Deltaproteobacteria bacterium]|nr:radical SAM protein [Deltaproteobacteria bacterium]